MNLQSQFLNGNGPAKSIFKKKGINIFYLTNYYKTLISQEIINVVLNNLPSWHLSIQELIASEVYNYYYYDWAFLSLLMSVTA